MIMHCLKETIWIIIATTIYKAMNSQDLGMTKILIKDFDIFDKLFPTQLFNFI